MRREHIDLNAIARCPRVIKALDAGITTLASVQEGKFLCVTYVPTVSQPALMQGRVVQTTYG